GELGLVHRPSEIAMSEQPAARRRWLMLGVSSLLALLAGAALWWLPRPAIPDSAAGPSSVATPSPGPDDPDAAQRRLVIGTWEDDYQGKRTMTLNADGTGTMIVELSGIRAALSAPRLRFDMKWSLANGRLQKQTLSGEPAATVQFILKTMGDRVDEPIEQLDAERLVLLDKDGKTRYEWRRVGR